MLVAGETSHDDISPLNDEASMNMYSMFITEETSHDGKSWLKDEAYWNMLFV